MEKSEALTILKNFFDKEKIKFAIIGGYAASAWGVVRATKDVDILAHITKTNLKKIASELQIFGFHAEVIHGDADDPIAGLIKLDYESMQGIELIEIIIGIKKISPEILNRAIVLNIFNTEIPVISPEDFILIKLLAGSPLDIQDAQGVMDVMKGRLDMDYLSGMCKKLHLKLMKLKY